MLNRIAVRDKGKGASLVSLIALGFICQFNSGESSVLTVMGIILSLITYVVIQDAANIATFFGRFIK